MKRAKKASVTSLDDLYSDIFRIVFMFIAQSCDGARELARASSVCKSLKKAVEDTEVLEFTEFQYKPMSQYPSSFWNTRGMLITCARAGNRAARSLFLQHMRNRVRVLKVKRGNVERAKQFYLEVAAVGHKGASLAKAEYEYKKNDLEKENDEMADHFEAFKSIFGKFSIYNVGPIYYHDDV